MKDKYYKEGYMKPIDIDDVIGPWNPPQGDDGYNRCQPIAQCTMEGKLVRTWESVPLASNTLGIRKSSIYNNLRNLNHSAGGFVWRYA